MFKNLKMEKKTQLLLLHVCRLIMFSLSLLVSLGCITSTNLFVAIGQHFLCLQQAWWVVCFARMYPSLGLNPGPSWWLYQMWYGRPRAAWFCCQLSFIINMIFLWKSFLKECILHYYSKTGSLFIIIYVDCLCTPLSNGLGPSIHWP